MSQKQNNKNRTRPDREPVRSAQKEDRASRTAVEERSSRSENPLLRVYLAAEHEMTRAKRRWRHIVKEKRAHHFPESERLVIQLLLFAWGMLPMLGSKLQEYTLGRQKKVYKNSRFKLWMERHRIHPALFLTGSCAVAAVALFMSIYTTGTTVMYDGEVIACVGSEEEAEAVRTDLEQETSKTLGETFTIDDSLIQYSTGWLKRSDLTGVEVWEDYLSDTIDVVTTAYTLYVDGVEIGSTP